MLYFPENCDLSPHTWVPLCVPLKKTKVKGAYEEVERRHEIIKLPARAQMFGVPLPLCPPKQGPFGYP